MTTKTVDASARLKRQYNDTFRAELTKELKLKSVSEAPKLTKIVVRGKTDRAGIVFIYTIYI